MQKQKQIQQWEFIMKFAQITKIVHPVGRWLDQNQLSIS